VASSWRSRLASDALKENLSVPSEYFTSCMGTWFSNPMAWLVVPE